ncbi:helix-turn-helix domain-containing protein [Pseudenterobacter timonensis]|uniref:Helix-turn-helix domain-containing protein n=1 Tax=Pseudenterobacter timonensis TaxID=1755099 RepID=A0AAE4DQ43_9ENTR|nr:helix-turn-helix domain-containing protein [Pseudenterobacter timonensis]MDR9891636.1 helix-turn-helix domain-containing protein [Pseudenterobacter timonensis]
MSLTSGSVAGKETSPYGRVLIEALRPQAKLMKIAPRRNLYLRIDNELYCYLLLEGSFGVYRKSDDRMLVIISGPSILGLSGLVTGNATIYLKALVPCVAAKIPLKTVQRTIEEQDLWEALSRYMMLIAVHLYIAGEQLSAPTASETVYTQLKVLMTEDPSIRNKITAERYIRDKTELSRSMIMRILSDLKKGGYIEIQKGILVNLHGLPEKKVPTFIPDNG